MGNTSSTTCVRVCVCVCLCVTSGDFGLSLYRVMFACMHVCTCVCVCVYLGVSSTVLPIPKALWKPTYPFCGKIVHRRTLVFVLQTSGTHAINTAIWITTKYPNYSCNYGDIPYACKNSHTHGIVFLLKEMTVILCMVSIICVMLVQWINTNT